jgi:hypothetical protein
VIEHLPSKRDTLRSNPSTTKNQTNKNKTPERTKPKTAINERENKEIRLINQNMIL